MVKGTMTPKPSTAKLAMPPVPRVARESKASDAGRTIPKGGKGSTAGGRFIPRASKK
jgi:hypothetical protein